MGLLLLTLISYGLVLNSWFFIEIQFNGVAFVKFDEIVNPMENTFLTNLNIFVYTMFFFSLSIYKCL